MTAFATESSKSRLDTVTEDFKEITCDELDIVYIVVYVNTIAY